MLRQRLRGPTGSPPVTAGLLAVVLGTALAACSVSTAQPPGSSGPSARSSAGVVVLATHDSWYVPPRTVKEFKARTGYELQVIQNGDAGELTNKLVLTKDQPLADVVFGIDNTFASRAVDEGVLARHTPRDLPPSADRYTVPGDDAGDLLTPVDWGDVCVNVDDAWFDEHQLRPPRSLEDLTRPAYRDLFVTPAASTSSPGFAFLLATIGTYGEDGWQDYWRRLMANGTRITSGWSDAYEVDFTAGGGHGDRPIVLSYNSSPPFTIPKGGTRPTTSALLDTCFRQVEYAGVLDGARNPEGAAAFVDFMTGRDFQEILPHSMYVFPVDSSVRLPMLWARWAKPAPHPIQVDPGAIAANRDRWLREWSDVTSS